MRRGQRIAERFEILEHAGAGGMGTVYRALDAQTGRPVAVKLLTLDEGSSAERFAREVTLLAQLSHPGIVGYVSHGDVGGKHYLVMEWVDGETLNRVLEREGLNVQESLTLTIAVANALEELHQRGLVHRDIKPSNLIFPEHSLKQIKVLDFGLARHAEELNGPTRTGLMVGSPGYMSPEQARGEREVSAAADVFSLGCVLYECLTGRAAFEGSDPVAIRSKVLMTEPIPARELNAEVPLELARLLEQMMAKTIDDRPAGGGEVARAAAAIVAPKASSRRKRSRTRLEGVTAFAASESSVVMVAEETKRPVAPISSPSAIAGPCTVQFVILVGSEGETTPPPSSVRAAVISQGGTVEVLDTGQIVAVLAGTRAPVEEAARAARLALAMHARLPDLPITLVADCSSRPDLGDLIERGVQAMHLESMESLFAGAMSGEELAGGVRLDPQSLRLLENQFEVQKRPMASYLLGEAANPPE